MAVLSQMADIQSQIQAALRRGDTAEALRLQSQAGQPTTAVADAPPASPLSGDTPSLSSMAGIESQPAKPMTPGSSPKPNITQKDLEAATGKDGKVNWWMLLAKTLAVPAATTAIGAALGGEKGAMMGAQAGASAVKGYQEGKGIAEESQDKQKLSDLANRRQKSIEDRQKSDDERKAAQDKESDREKAARLFASNHAETPALDPADKASILDDENRKAGEADTKRKQGIADDIEKEKRAEARRVEAEKRREQDQQEREKRADERKAAVEAGKPLTDAQVSAALKDLDKEENEKKALLYPTFDKDGNEVPPDPTVAKAAQDDIARIAQKREALRSKRKGFMGKVGGAGKGKAAGELSPQDRARVQRLKGKINRDTGATYTEQEAIDFIQANQAQ